MGEETRKKASFPLRLNSNSLRPDLTTSPPPPPEIDVANCLVAEEDEEQQPIRQSICCLPHASLSLPGQGGSDIFGIEVEALPELSELSRYSSANFIV